MLHRRLGDRAKALLHRQRVRHGLRTLQASGADAAQEVGRDLSLAAFLWCREGDGARLGARGRADDGHQLVKEAVHDETTHDDDQARDVGAAEGLMVGHEGQSERHVAHRDHDGQGEPEQGSRPILEHEDDENVVRQVEHHVDRHVQRCAAAIVDLHAVRGSAVEDAVLANVAEDAVPSVLGDLAERQVGRIRRRDGHRDGDKELEQRHPAIHVDSIDLHLAQCLLLVHRGQSHGHAGENHDGDPHDLRQAGPRVRVTAIAEGRQQHHDDADHHDEGTQTLPDGVLGAQKEVGDDHGHRNGGLLQQDDQRRAGDVSDGQHLHQARDRVQDAHDCKLVLRDLLALLADRRAVLDHGNDVQER
mmetsp:Transcript_3096/g.9550  ORF Transcript_3096/g.9550 Transcript_3096/m.9550 type:complete len:361 (-) Transcript_3096:291-1373(-)